MLSEIAVSTANDSLKGSCTAGVAAGPLEVASTGDSMLRQLVSLEYVGRLELLEKIQQSGLTRLVPLATLELAVQSLAVFLQQAFQYLRQLVAPLE